MKISDLLGNAGSMLNVRNIQPMPTMPNIMDQNIDDKIVVVVCDNDDGLELDQELPTVGDASKDVVNPGIEYGNNGRAKWSPPLQQQLSVMKDAIGTTTDDTTIEPTNDQKDALVAARNNTGSNSNSAVDMVNNNINAQNNMDSSEMDVLERLRQLAAIVNSKQQRMNTNSNPVINLLTRNNL